MARRNNSRKKLRKSRKIRKSRKMMSTRRRRAGALFGLFNDDPVTPENYKSQCSTYKTLLSSSRRNACKFYENNSRAQQVTNGAFENNEYNENMPMQSNFSEEPQYNENNEYNGYNGYQ